MLEETTAAKALVGYFHAGRKVRKFGNKTSGYQSPEEAYGTTDKGSTFKTLKNAVFFYYHLNTGSGKSVSAVKAKLDPNEKLGGMRRAQQRAPAFVDYIRSAFKGKGVVFSQDSTSDGNESSPETTT